MAPALCDACDTLLSLIMMKWPPACRTHGCVIRVGFSIEGLAYVCYHNYEPEFLLVEDRGSLKDMADTMIHWLKKKHSQEVNDDGMA